MEMLKIMWDAPAPVVSHQQNRKPKGEIGMIMNGDIALRTGVFVPKGEAQATIVLMMGFSEFIEKYYSVIKWFCGRGYVVVVPEWRGHGLSSKTSQTDDCLHVTDLDINISDLEVRMRRIVLPHCPGPVFGLAHSMGGQISLRATAMHPDWFCALAQSAPMYGLAISNLVVSIIAMIGRGLILLDSDRGRALSDIPVFGQPDSVNVITHSAKRFAFNRELCARDPRLWIRRPSIGWISAAWRAMRSTLRPDFLRMIRTPLFVARAGDEKLVDNAALDYVVERVADARSVFYRSAMHEIMMERDSVRTRFLENVDDFFKDVRQMQAEAR